VTQIQLPLAVQRQSGLTLVDRLARYFQARPNVWIDGRELGTVAGGYAWRTRCSDLRKAPYVMRIENRKQRVTKANGEKFTISDYRYVP
jgi:hypothetical protein